MIYVNTITISLTIIIIIKYTYVIVNNNIKYAYNTHQQGSYQIIANKIKNDNNVIHS